MSRAFFYAAAVRPVYVKLPDEDREDGDAGICGKLRVSMYGTRDAALNWALEYAGTLIAAGYKQGLANPCLFYNLEKDVTIVVHGDDFMCVGHEHFLGEVEAALKEKYKIKTEKLGCDDKDCKEVKILNKIVRVTEEGLELEADPMSPTARPKSVRKVSATRTARGEIRNPFCSSALKLIIMITNKKSTMMAPA